jgi:hypothetical protein
VFIATSSIFWYCLFRHYILFIYLFICNCLFPVTIVRHCRLRESLGARRSRLWAATSERTRQVTLDHINPMCFLSLSSSYTGLHALILLAKPYTLVMLNPTVMRVVQAFHPLWCWILACVCVRVWSSIRRDVIWPCEDRCCDLSNGWKGWDG